jgi:hypothetical protein
MEAAINAIQCELAKTIKNRVEGVLASVDQRRQGLSEEIKEAKKDLRQDVYLRVQGTWVEMETAWQKFETQLKEAEA